MKILKSSTIKQEDKRLYCRAESQDQRSKVRSEGLKAGLRSEVKTEEILNLRLGAKVGE